LHPAGGGPRPVGRLGQGWGMRRGRMAVPVDDRSAFAGFRFPPDVITLAVRWYLRYGLSYRDLEELLTERGLEVDHVTVCRWVQRFTPLFADAARPCRHAVGDRWFVDEAYVKVAGRWRYLYRAIDQFGQVIDVLVSVQRDTVAARRFFTRALTYGPAPVEVTTDKAAAYLRVLADLVPEALHLTEDLVPGRLAGDPLLPERVRALTGGQLAPARDRLDRQHRLLLAALAAAPECTVSFPRGDLCRGPLDVRTARPRRIRPA